MFSNSGIRQLIMLVNKLPNNGQQFFHGFLQGEDNRDACFFFKGAAEGDQIFSGSARTI